MPETYQNIARIVRTHGAKGEVVVAPLRGLPFLLHEGMEVALTPPALKRERFSRVEGIRGAGDDMLVRFSCAHDLDEAVALAGCTVLARRCDLSLGALDVAFDDLIGRSVVDTEMGQLGTIAEIMETPAHPVWVVRGRAGETLIPEVPAMIVAIPPTGVIEVSLPAGLVSAAAGEA